MPQYLAKIDNFTSFKHPNLLGKLMPTRNINLTDRYDSFLTRQISSGRFKNASEVVRAALHLLEREELEAKAKLEALRREVKVGEDAYSRGEVFVIEDDAALSRFFSQIAKEVAET